MAQGGKRKKRERAVQVLYGLSFSPPAGPADLKKAYCKFPSEADEGADATGFAWELTNGVWQHQEELDREIENFALNWRTDQIGRIEMVLMRLALYEMHYVKTPPKVAISEYLEIAGQFGADAAKGFINGVLNAAARANPDTAGQIRTQKGK